MLPEFTHSARRAARGGVVGFVGHCILSVSGLFETKGTAIWKPHLAHSNRRTSLSPVSSRTPTRNFWFPHVHCTAPLTPSSSLSALISFLTPRSAAAAEQPVHLRDQRREIEGPPARERWPTTAGMMPKPEVARDLVALEGRPASTPVPLLLSFHARAAHLGRFPQNIGRMFPAFLTFAAWKQTGQVLLKLDVTY